MTAVIIPIRVGKRVQRIERLQMRLSQTALELWADRPWLDLAVAIPAGYRALERGESIFEALEVVEGILGVMAAISPSDHIYRDGIQRLRNIERLSEYRIKLTNRRRRLT